MPFWKNLPKPFFAMAPLADVTDAAFRRIIAKYSRHGEEGGGPDVFWTEFVSADGLMSQGREVLKHDLLFTEGEHPIVAQLFGSNPENMAGASALCAELGFDGVDINMGCPDRSIEKQGAGAAMIKDPAHAKVIIEAARAGAESGGRRIPISVKTRVGYNKVAIDEWIPELLGYNISALTVHARTRKEMSSVPARWEHIKDAVAIRDKLGVATLIIGNGDVKDLIDAEEKARVSGCDGVMLGRAIFGNPWLFDQKRMARETNLEDTDIRVLANSSARASRAVQGLSNQFFSPVATLEKLNVMVEHTKLFEKLLGEVKSFAIMKKHYKAYVNGFDGAKELRMQLMEMATGEEIEVAVENFLAEHQNLV